LKKNTVIVLAEDDEGHAGLIIRNLRRTGITNEIIHFRDGEETLKFLLGNGEGVRHQDDKSYLLLLDLRMPKVDGIEVMRRVKHDEALRRMPVIVITTTDDPGEIELCYALGCSSYIVKPVNYDEFNEAFRQLGQYLSTAVFP
jgi:CheY-like chemotaxis protein